MTKREIIDKINEAQRLLTLIQDNIRLGDDIKTPDTASFHVEVKAIIKQEIARHMHNNNHTQDKEYLTCSEVANYLSIAKSTVYKWSCASKESPIPVYKFGKNVRFKKSDIDEYAYSNIATQPD